MATSKELSVNFSDHCTNYYIYDTISDMLRRLYVVHPFLFALFPVLFLFSHNLGQASLSDVVLPVSIILFAVSSLFLVLWFGTKDAVRAGFMVSLFVLLFFSFGHIRYFVGDAAILGVAIGRERYILLFLISIFALGAFALLKIKKNLFQLNKILNGVAAVLVVISLFNIVVYQIGRRTTQQNYAKTIGKIGEIKDRPNIYYIILDGYANASTLKALFKYDNTGFIEFLTSRGFTVTGESRSNYAWTFLSLASSLNMVHVNNFTDTIGRDSQDRTVPFEMVENNEIQRQLKARGYKFIFISSGLSRMTASNKFADLNLKESRLSEFSTALLETTALYPFMRRIIGTSSQQAVLYAFDSLSKVPNFDEPRFTFAHITIPHPPYLFGPNGESIEDPTAKLPGYNRWKLKDYYVNHIIFTNKKVMELVDVILRKEKTPPIIIFQADHGTLSEGDQYNNFSQLTDTLAKERMKIFSAYYLPGEGKNILYSSITPVNSFRKIFNYYFKTDYPLLEDTSFISTDDQPYNFIDVTNIASKPF